MGELAGQEARRKEAEDRARIKGMIYLDASRLLPGGPRGDRGVVERGDTLP